MRDYGQVERTEANNHLNLVDLTSEVINMTYDYADNLLRHLSLSCRIAGRTKLYKVAGSCPATCSVLRFRCLLMAVPWPSACGGLGATMSFTQRKKDMVLSLLPMIKRW